MSRKASVNERRELRRNRHANKGADIHDLYTGETITDQISEIGMAVDRRKNTSPLEPRTPNQHLYLQALRSKDLVFATGEAGCGKTYLCTTHAADKLLAKEIDKIILTRPILSADEDLGFLPGDVSEKVAPYFRPIYDVLNKRLGYSFLKYCLKPEVAKVEIAPLAYMRGRSFENAIIILDEAQNTTVKQMKLFLTRIGDNCQVIVNGDIDQIDLPFGTTSGLVDAIDRFYDDETVSVIRFNRGDCVRSAICSRVLSAYK